MGQSRIGSSKCPSGERVGCCGNFDAGGRTKFFGNRRAERAGVLDVHPWADDRPAKDRERRGAILRDNWREHFERLFGARGQRKCLCHNRS